MTRHCGHPLCVIAGDGCAFEYERPSGSAPAASYSVDVPEARQDEVRDLLESLNDDAVIAEWQRLTMLGVVRRLAEIVREERRDGRELDDHQRKERDAKLVQRVYDRLGGKMIKPGVGIAGHVPKR